MTSNLRRLTPLYAAVGRSRTLPGEWTYHLYTKYGWVVDRTVPVRYRPRPQPREDEG